MSGRQTPAERLGSIGPRQRRGEAVGIYSICSSHPTVLEAAFGQAADDQSPLLVEATCNQVNQSGGYSGMTPADFVGYVRGMARRMGFAQERLMIGGDHLGPYVWRRQAAGAAMQKAEKLVSECVRAGYAKIHLDASMPLGGDGDGPIPVELSAGRAAVLCRAAERAAQQAGPDNARPLYVIGAEVPTPGGSTAEPGDVPVSDPGEVDRFIRICKSEFFRQGLDEAWNRVIAVVVQPGIDFGETWVAPFDPAAAGALSTFHRRLPRAMTYEIHATDFQAPGALDQMVRAGFALMKIGPCLTHAFREAVFGLECIEREWLGGRKSTCLSGIREVIGRAMDADPAYWKSHHGADSASHWTVLFGYLDRVRYYWARPEVAGALERLVNNLSGNIPSPLLSQYLPDQYAAIREGRLSRHPLLLARHKVRCALSPYATACQTAGAAR